jgi:hypothetical protein
MDSEKVGTIMGKLSLLHLDESFAEYESYPFFGVKGL